MTGFNKRALVAHHEAAHAVVNYRAGGSAAGPISLVPDPDDPARLGVHQDVTSDSFDPGSMEARVLSCYAGGHANRHLDPTLGDRGCEIDDEIASEILAKFGWTDRESALRAQSLNLVVAHWREVAAVAAELLQAQSQTLDETEIETIADIAAGDATPRDLAIYRVLKAGTLPKGED